MMEPTTKDYFLQSTVNHFNKNTLHHYADKGAVFGS